MLITPPWDDVAAKMVAAAGDEKPMDILSWVCCCGEASHVVKSCAHYHIISHHGSWILAHHLSCCDSTTTIKSRGRSYSLLR